MAKIKHISTATYEDNPKRYNEDIENGLVCVDDCAKCMFAEVEVDDTFDPELIVKEVKDNGTLYTYEGVCLFVPVDINATFKHKNKLRKNKTLNEQDICCKLKHSVLRKRYVKAFGIWLKDARAYVVSKSNVTGGLNVVRL